MKALRRFFKNDDVRDAMYPIAMVGLAFMAGALLGAPLLVMATLGVTP